MSWLARQWRLLASLLSGLLLAFAFPPFEVAGLAWVALIPLLLALLRKPAGGATSLKAVFLQGFGAGFVFWAVVMGWMFRLFETSPAPAVLIVLGWFLLCAYCALYFGVFTMTVAWLVRKIDMQKLWQTSLLTMVIPVLWVGGEMVRSYGFTGFPWNLLGISQFRNIVLIQCAQWVGVAGVSALVMLANTGLALSVLRYLPPREMKYRPHLELFLMLMTIALCFRAGVALVRAQVPTGGWVEIAAVQPAIPQVKKWSQEQIDRIHSTFRRLTTQVAQDGDTYPDLIIWPETATPYCVTEVGESRDLVMELSRTGRTPLLVGSMDVTPVDGELICYNGSFLFDTNGVMARKYYKQHLVPFGEYVPLSEWIPALASLAPMGWNCLPGREATVFRVGAPEWTFSCLICFEDIMADLSRAFVKAGARLLVNQTNDAWFDRSAGPVQHLSHGVFRCVENRVPAIRVANSGISCVIQPSGAISEPTENDRHHPPREAAVRWQIFLPDVDASPTVYTRYGDWLFGIPCAVVAVVCAILALASIRRQPGPG